MIAVEKDLRFEAEGQLVAWLSGVVRHCALNHRRKRQRRKTQATDPVVLTNVEGSEPTEIQHQDALHLTDSQTSFDDEVVNALMQLTPEARACLLLRSIEQLSYKEISQLMDMPEGTALSLVHRSRKKLRQLLTEKDLASTDVVDKAGIQTTSRFTS
jgi:RNA polymerase sigma-70 factor (ECF subfamily)